MDKYRDGQEREMAKWAHDRLIREREEHMATMSSKLNDIYEGYYPEEDG